MSGASAYTNVNALSAATTAINQTLNTVSGAAHSKITSLSAATTAHTADTTVHVTAANKTAWTNGANSGASAYTAVTQLSGVVSTIQGLPAVTSSNNGKILRVVNGQWALVDPTTVFTGSGSPSQSLGVNGDIYLQS